MQIEGFSIFYILYMVLAIGLSIQILLDNKTAQSTLAWIFAIFLIPYVGAVFYLLSGINWRRRGLVKQRPEDLFGRYLKEEIKTQGRLIEKEAELLGSDMSKILTLTLKSGNSIVTRRNTIQLYFHGEELFQDLIKDLEDAVQSIHIEYFIYRYDDVGRKIIDILEKKAAEGVEVRLIVDGSGSFLTLPPKARRRIRRSKIQFHDFLNPANFITGWLLNYSSHRKIVVIDGQIGYSGGMNIGREYIDGGKRFPDWRDTHIRFYGDSVPILQSVFISDWINSGGTYNTEDAPKHFIVPHDFPGKTISTQILCSGPDSRWYSIQQLYFNMITNADKNVYIQSPYFIPDESITTAMETAALSGIEVHLMITGLPDKRVPFWVAHTYFPSLLSAGVNIYLYEKGFLHAKNLIIDDTIVTAGSCNMDQRSFFLDYELNAVFYDHDIAVAFRKQFEKDLENCRVFTKKDLEQIKRIRHFRNSVFRMIAPLL